MRALAEAGTGAALVVDDRAAVDRTIRAGTPVVSPDLRAVVAADGVDVVVDVTGAVELGAHVALECFTQGKHLVLMNAEVDATVGPEVARRADSAGVVYTGCDGDQPACR